MRATFDGHTVDIKQANLYSSHRPVHHARHRRQGEQRLHEGADRPRAPRVLLPRPVRAHPRPGHARADHLGRSGAPRRHRLRADRRRLRPGRARAARPRRQADAGGAVGAHRRHAEVDQADRGRRVDGEGQAGQGLGRGGARPLGRRAPSRPSISGDISPRLFQWALARAGRRRLGRHQARRAHRRRLEPSAVAGHAPRSRTCRSARASSERDIRLDGGTVTFENFDVVIGCPRDGRAARRLPLARTASSTTTRRSTASTAASASATSWRCKSPRRLARRQRDRLRAAGLVGEALAAGRARRQRQRS